MRIRPSIGTVHAIGPEPLQGSGIRDTIVSWQSAFGELHMATRSDIPLLTHPSVKSASQKGRADGHPFNGDAATKGRPVAMIVTACRRSG
jgi:hypothetical protein